jgi:hypothetical protein
MRLWLGLAVVALVTARPAFADPDPEPAKPDEPKPAEPKPEEPKVEPKPAEPPIEQPTEPPPLHEDDEFGPVIQIEAIEIKGNTATDEEVIRRALPIAPGDVLHASDKRMRDVRFKVLALGYFRDVTLAMHKGSERGQVIVEVTVIERGTIVLNRLWFGSNSLSPYWIGADVGERNLLGLGVALGGGFVFADHGDVAGSRDQYAGEIRASDSSVLGTAFGINGSLTLVHGSEAYRVAGADTDNSDGNFLAFPYRRIGGRAGLTYDASALSRLSAGIRAEVIDTDLPVVPTQVLPGGRTTAIDLHLVPGRSRVMTAGVGYDRDDRPDPILPHSGERLTISAELGSSLLGGSYNFATLYARYEHWWPLTAKQSLGLRLAGGVVIGDAPRFDRIYISDVDHMLTPRALGLVLSTAAPLGILGTRSDKPSYGDVGGLATIEYSRELFRGSGKNRVYGGDIFLAVGLWGLAENGDLTTRDTSVWKSLPIDGYADAGVRIDTDIGVFELTIANALGRLR